jgi:hypothetical protein
MVMQEEELSEARRGCGCTLLIALLLLLLW